VSAAIASNAYAAPLVICQSGYYFSYSGGASPSVANMQAATCTACPSNAYVCTATNGALSNLVCNGGYVPLINGINSRCI